MMISRNQFSFSILLNSSRSDEIFLLRTLKRWRKKKKVRCIFWNACKYFTILAEIMSTSTKKIVIFLRFHVKKLKINFFDWNSVKVIKCQLSIILQLIEIHVRLLLCQYIFLLRYTYIIGLAMCKLHSTSTTFSNEKVVVVLCCWILLIKSET